VEIDQEILDMYRSGRQPETIRQHLNAQLPPDQQLISEYLTAVITAASKESAYLAKAALENWHGDHAMAHHLRIIWAYIAELEQKADTLMGFFEDSVERPADQPPVDDASADQPFTSKRGKK